jgi:hypothetical protein
MSDESGVPPGEPLIDVRSPAERWAEAGRAGADRLHASIQEQPLGAAAMCWLLAVMVIVATNVYSELHLDTGVAGGPFTGGWVKLLVLSESAGLEIAIATLVGLALAVLAGRSRAGIAYQLALVLAAWTVVAAVCGVVAAVHGFGYPLFANANNRFAFGLQSFASLVLGIVVFMIAWKFATSPRADGSDEEQEQDEPELAELS